MFQKLRFKISRLFLERVSQVLMNGFQHSSVHGYVYAWIFENGVKELNSRLRAGVFISSQRLSKSDDNKIERKVSPFFVLHSFIFFSLPSFLYFFTLFHGLEAALRSSEIKVKYG